MKEKYSGKEIIKAGEKFLQNDIFERQDEFDLAMDTLSYWRFQHEKPLEKALFLLKSKSEKIDRKVILAKRLKRYPSILLKLRRFPKMKLKNMQDIGGCRAILSSQKKLYQIVKELRRDPRFKNNKGEIRYKDYVKEPKDDGYRGYHLIGSFDGEYGKKKLIELQLRTSIQHDWATALEIVDLFTGQALKSNRGEEDWKVFFKLVSHHFSVMESIHIFRQKTRQEQLEHYALKINKNKELYRSGKKIYEYESILKVVKTFEAFAHSLKIVDNHISKKQVSGYVLIKVNTAKSNVASTLFEEDKNDEAEKMYLQFEKEATKNKDLVVALVSTTAVGGIKEAFPNYFADSREFLLYLIHILTVHKVKKTSFFEKMLQKAGF